MLLYTYYVPSAVLHDNMSSPRVIPLERGSEFAEVPGLHKSCSRVWATRCARLQITRASIAMVVSGGASIFFLAMRGIPRAASTTCRFGV